MIKDFSVVLLFSQRDDQEINIFFYFGTTFTTAWSREKKFLFSFHHYICYAMVIGEKKDFYCTLTMVRSWKNILVFYFTTTFTMQVSPYIYQLYSLRHWTVEKVFFPEKYHNLKNFFLRSFRGVLHDLLSVNISVHLLI